MDARDLVACVLSCQSMQVVVDCTHLPVGDVNKTEVKEAYEALSTTEQWLFKSRVNRYAIASAHGTTPEAKQQLKMLQAVQEAIK